MAEAPIISDYLVNRNEAIMRFLLAFLLCLFGSGAARAQPAPSLLDLNLLPAISAAGRASYATNFLLGALPRVFVIASNGEYGTAWGGK